VHTSTPVNRHPSVYAVVHKSNQAYTVIN